MSPFIAIFRVDGIPKAQPRPRAFARRMGDKHVARVFDDGTAEGWKSLVVAAGNALRPKSPLTGPVLVAIDFAMPRPKSLMRKCDPAGEVWCVKKPDADNLAKAVLDALTQAGWWVDDAQVARLIVNKRYHAKNARPGADVWIHEELEGARQ